MARIRTIKPEFPHSETVGALSKNARLFFIMMWTIADDAGRLRGSSRALASLLYPYDDGENGRDLTTAADVESWIKELESQGSIVRYQVGGNRYIQIAKWLEHQKIDRPSQSKIPAFDEECRIIASPREPSATDLVPGPGPLPRKGPVGSGENFAGTSASSFPPDAPPDGVAQPDEQPDLLTTESQADEPDQRTVKAQNRGSRLAPDWRPDPKLVEFAQELGIDVEWELSKFRDHWTGKPGKDGYKSDWAATWRNWCRTSAERKSGRGNGGTGQGPNRPGGGGLLAAGRAAASGGPSGGEW